MYYFPSDNMILTNESNNSKQVRIYTSQGRERRVQLLGLQRGMLTGAFAGAIAGVAATRLYDCVSLRC